MKFEDAGHILRTKKVNVELSEPYGLHSLAEFSDGVMIFLREGNICYFDINGKVVWKLNRDSIQRHLGIEEVYIRYLSFYRKSEDGNCIDFSDKFNDIPPATESLYKESSFYGFVRENGEVSFEGFSPEDIEKRRIGGYLNPNFFIKYADFIDVPKEEIFICMEIQAGKPVHSIYECTIIDGEVSVIAKKQPERGPG